MKLFERKEDKVFALILAAVIIVFMSMGIVGYISQKKQADNPELYVD